MTRYSKPIIIVVILLIAAAAFWTFCAANTEEVAGSDRSLTWDRVFAQTTYEDLSASESYEDFLISTEKAKRRFRDLGLQLVEGGEIESVQLARWLVATVHLSPDYPIDLDEWTTARLSIEPATFEVDEELRSAWDQEYEELSTLVEASGALTPVAERYLRFGELEEKIKRGVIAAGSDFDVDAFLTDLQVFTRVYPEQFDIVDRSNYSSIISQLFNQVTAHPQLFDTDERTLESVYGEIASWDLGYMSQLAKITHVQESLNRYARFAYASLVWFPRGGDGVDFVANIRGEELRRRYEGLLQVHFDEFTPEEQFSLMQLARARAPMFPKGGALARLQYSAMEMFALPIDLPALEHQQSFFRDKLTYLTMISSTDDQRINAIRVAGLLTDFTNAQRLWRQFGDKAAVTEFQDELVSLGAIAELEETVARWAGRTIRYQHRLGMDIQDAHAFADRFSMYAGEAFVQFRAMVNQRLSLFGEPFEFGATYLDGRDFDMTSYVGKVVLVDHWNTNCSACIAAMPDLHDLYLKLKPQGFEVVSIAYDATSKRSRVDRITEQLGLTWPTVNGEGLWQGVRDKYGYNGFPQYMLLDREGRLIADTAELLQQRDREARVRELVSVRE